MDYTKNYTYDMLEKDLETGHEIEFYYHSKKYSISYNKDGWYLTEYNNPVYQTFKDAENLLNRGKVDGFLLKEIWGGIKVDEFF